MVKRAPSALGEDIGSIPTLTWQFTPPVTPAIRTK